MPAHFMTWVFIVAAGLIAVTSVPLIMKKVPMNRWTGVRFKVCYESDELWYRINVFGGWMLLTSSLAIMALGVVSLWLFPKPDEWHALYLAGALVMLYVAATAGTYGYAMRASKGHQTIENE